MKLHVKKGDEVVVIAGSAKGRRGKVRTVLTKRHSVILEAADEGRKDDDADSKEPADKRKMIKPTLHYLRKSQDRPQGGLLWLEGPIHASNVKLADDKSEKAEKTEKAASGAKKKSAKKKA